ncbi:nucleotidyltransferase domain-containing protein [Myxococcus llanfairpwllgwyngyllgogerychwyrndrobwllllantysiliogogogochensis]|uniref:Nucleotidyltransferase domain-containing protein n=1 Tax=Myxococcus llanfairpwllgwyngyllgogerychwyrndrobwllllantysiliogogogochensis TaxID=2590453 RepID=A0A540WXD5_9BACT|nr:nucleotidyltransferase domain-containing protein [Myxococcus llanfairpwllgwyngyllgogerychwyrndrobwllllantysiliogogogochensis]TQF13662.1 nucleotidyltransferase domain-containing protein [Myxococcus llanfairpwllgwyngyllgogerychwyrndrobwllllantysiliogogogochensis]
MKGAMTEHERKVADGVLDEESAKREHLVVSLSGAHAYGFPSPDSDLDLKSIHIAPTALLLGLQPRQLNAERLQVVDGVEVDYSSNELQPVLQGLLQGNGNYLERLLGAIPVRVSPELEALQPLVRGVLSRRVHRHYRGFAHGQLREWEKSGFRSAKKLLYVLRTTLTGTHALRTGEVETDVTELLDSHGFAEAHELVEQKRRGEKSELPESLSAKWRAEVARSFEVLDAALEASVLPEEPSQAAVDALEAWMLDLRRRRFVAVS